MRILIYGINFAPELTGIGKYTGEMAAWLAGRGHEVRVVTAPPYYPEWRIRAGYSAWTYQIHAEKEKRLRVYRCPLWVPARPSGIKRIAHLASFALSSLPVMLGQAAWRPDLVWVVEPPLFCAPAALLVARLSGAKAWLHVQDFEVDAAFKLGLLSSRGFYKLATGIECWLMGRFDRVSTISDKMLERLSRKGVKKGILFPNWVDTEHIFPMREASSLRRELGLPDRSVVALYAGNMGRKQGLETVVRAARLLTDRTNLRFILCGEGAAKAELVRLAAGMPNVNFLPLQPVERLNDLLNMADIHLLPQDEGASDLVMPSKLTGMLASGRPVVANAAAGTQVAKVVQPCGKVVPPGDARAFADAIVALAEDRQAAQRLGAAGRAYAVKMWGREAVLHGFERMLGELKATGLGR